MYLQKCNHWQPHRTTTEVCPPTGLRTIVRASLRLQVQVAHKNHSLLVSGSSTITPYQRIKEFCTGLLLNLFISFYTHFNNKFIFHLFKLASQKHNLNQKSLQLNVLMCYIHIVLLLLFFCFFSYWIDNNCYHGFIALYIEYVQNLLWLLQPVYKAGTCFIVFILWDFPPTLRPDPVKTQLYTLPLVN